MEQTTLALAALNDLDESGGVLSYGLEEKRLRSYHAVLKKKGYASYPLYFGASYGHPEVVKRVRGRRSSRRQQRMDPAAFGCGLCETDKA
jgi:hypothetical protein